MIIHWNKTNRNRIKDYFDIDEVFNWSIKTVIENEYIYQVTRNVYKKKPNIYSS